MTNTEAALALVTRFENEFNTRDIDASWSSPLHRIRQEAAPLLIYLFLEETRLKRTLTPRS